MIEKKTWNNFMEVLGQSGELTMFKDIYTKLSNIDTDYLDSSEKTRLINVYKRSMFIMGLDVGETVVYSPNLSSWKDMPIYISSFKPFSRLEFIEKLLFDLHRYIDSYILLITDNGFAKQVITTGSLNIINNGNSSSKDYFSETPQDVHSGDEALENLDYLSNASKNYVNTHDSSSQADESSQTTKTWEDNRRNMELVFFRDITYYIMKIPYLVYDYYALDQYPFPDTLKRFYENLEAVLTNE